jgi:hypothetical protein
MRFIKVWNTIEEDSFKDFSDLKTLIISYNKIQITEREVFVGLSNLNIFDLSHSRYTNSYH